MSQIYIHIPFCSSKCSYCRFASFSGIQKLQIAKYVDSLCQEIGESCYGGAIDTLYFGGGTPSVLSKKELEKIFSALQKKFSFSPQGEITLETTPQHGNRENILSWKNLGINRISIGVQSLNPQTLKAIERGEKGDIFTALETAEQENFPNVSVDFIIGLPYVKKGELKKDIALLLEKYSCLQHISVYMLEDYYDIPEEKNSVFDAISYPKGWKDESLKVEDYVEEYEEIKNFLEEKGFFSYELSNFAKKGYECQHNIGYWEHKTVYAFGLGASGFVGQQRYTNSENFGEYYGRKNIFQETLSNEDIRIEKIMFGLRRGTLEKKLLSVAGQKKVSEFREQGLLGEKKETIFLTKQGRVLLDYILSEIV